MFLFTATNYKALQIYKFTAKSIPKAFGIDTVVYFLMLPPKHRLIKDKDFRRVFRSGNNQDGAGRSFYLPELGIKCAPNDLSVSRFGFSVSLKVSKKATVRNRLKRQLREIIRLKLKKIKPGYDFVVITRPGILDFDYQQLDKKLDLIFKKLKVLK